ncbi:hypothetical protein B0A54_07139 [Friedmanniomyces endolithicus]|uniref:MARVEL domain-containing protein n=1 Tax=Friedmanniomyces endolithicus TaxID=329885 RepID=A0A4U0V3D7_9PEZI|nr:hypothetical protein LTS09_007271 [Friedmanniomyces endolithicus]TKA42923.1 hypothetical protein B0A54_07139 [Friedmanniomyces endolithicus]
MPVPDYGAAPLAKTFMLVRGLALFAMVCIVGLTANFVAEITCLAALYCMISIPFFYARANLGLFIMAGLDALLCLAFAIVAVILGRPLSFLNCMIIADGNAAANAQSATAFAQSLASASGANGSILGLQNWAASTKINCFETKAIWGLCIALCILFTCSSFILPTLWLKARRAGVPATKSVV